MADRSWLMGIGLLLMGCTDPTPSSNGEIESVPGVEDGNFDPNHIVQIELEMDQSDWDSLRMETQNFVTAFRGDCRDGPIGMDYTEFEASISMDGSELSPIRIRKKGLLGSQDTAKPSFSINLDEYIDGAELFGLDNLTLNNATQDESLIRQCLAYTLFEDAGLPAPRCNFARVSMNGDDLGIYAHVEPVRKSFLRDNFGNDEGDLYEGTVSDFVDGWYQTFDPDSDETDTDMEVVQELSAALADSSGPILDVLAPYVDVDQFLRFWAMETLTGHWDGYAGNRNNYFVYRNPNTDLFSFIPWGADATFVLYDDRNADAWIPASSTLAGRIASDDAGLAAFESVLDELLETVWDEARILDEIDRMEDLLATEIDIDDVEDGIDNVRDYVDARRESVADAWPPESTTNNETYCLDEIGTISASFSTDWGSTETAWDWTSAGALDMVLDWDGYVVAPEVGGVVSGEEDGDLGALAMYVLFVPEEQGYLLPYIVFDPDGITEGEEADFDRATIVGNFFYTDESMGGHFGQAAYMGGGTLQFDSLDMGSGGTVSGTLESYIYNWVETE